MLDWLTKVRARTRKPVPERPAAARTVAQLSDSATRPEVPAATSSSKLSASQVEFLRDLIEPPTPRPLERTSIDDRLFIGGIQRRWHARRLELPVLPAAALRLSNILRSADAPVAPLVELIENDAALSVEVLKSANSAMFAHGAVVRSVHDAVLRIGLGRLGAILLMAQLTRKVLKGGDVQASATLLTEITPLLGRVAGLLSATGDRADDQSFVTAALLHVEHLVILGAVADVARDHKRAVHPTVTALHEAFGRFGPEIRYAVANAWNLQSVMLLGPHGEAEFAGFRKAIVLRWLDEPLPELPGIERAHLEVAMSQIPARV